jgi:hypothetical protein
MIMQLAEYIGLIVILLCALPGIMVWLTILVMSFADSDEAHDLYCAWEDFLESLST